MYNQPTYDFSILQVPFTLTPDFRYLAVYPKPVLICLDGDVKTPERRINRPVNVYVDYTQENIELIYPIEKYTRTMRPSKAAALLDDYIPATWFLSNVHPGFYSHTEQQYLEEQRRLAVLKQRQEEERSLNKATLGVWQRVARVWHVLRQGEE